MFLSSTSTILYFFFPFLFFLGFLGCFSNPHQTPLPAFLSYAVAHVLLYFMVFRRTPDSFFPKKSRTSLLVNFLFSVPGILLVGIGLRILFIPYPISDDVHRYAWEGMIQNHGINPYLIPPLELEQWTDSEKIYEGINHKNHAAIYPPLTLLIFRGISTFVFVPNASPEMILMAFKIFFICCDILVIFTLPRLLKLWGTPPHWLSMYAWNPFILVYGIGEGHFELLQNVFLVLVLLEFQRKRNSFRLGYFSLGCAAMIKYIGVILLPFCITRKNAKNILFFFFPFLTYIFYWDVGIFDGLFNFSSHFHYNELIPKILRFFVADSFLLAIVAFIFCCGLFWVWLLWKEAPIYSMGISWMWLIVCLPTVHPWYLIPVMVFLMHKPSRAWLVLSIAMGSSFWVYHHQHQFGEWKEWNWVWCVTYIPFLILLFRDLGRNIYPKDLHTKPPSSIDIVVPTLNEGPRLDKFLSHLQDSISLVNDQKNVSAGSLKPTKRRILSPQVPQFRIILVDGGSTDHTVVIANKFHCEIIQAERASRGEQFGIGIAAGSGELILMIHADALISKNALKNLVSSFEKHKGLSWGILGHRYHSRNPKMRIIEVSNRLRFLLGGIAFGDQGIFVNRAVLMNVGGMPGHRLMEDVELSLRLANYTNRLNLGGMLTVSTRSWEKKEFTGYTFQVFKLVSTYLLLRRLGCDTEKIAEKMYQIYYQKN